MTATSRRDGGRDDHTGAPDRVGVAAWVLPALAAVMWGVTAAVGPGDVATMVAVGVGALVMAAVAWRRGSAILGAAAVLAIMGVAGGAAQSAAVTSGPWGALARERAVAMVELQVGPGRLWPARGEREGLWRGGATLLSAHVRGQEWTSRTPVDVVVAGPAAGAWSELPLGARITVSARLAAPDRGEAAWLLVRPATEPRVIAGPAPPWNVVGTLRAGLKQASDVLPGDARSLVPALVVGDTSGFPDELRQTFVTSGLTHVTAVSGANLTLMLSFLRVVAVGLGLRGPAVRFLGVAGVVGFVLLCLGEPSVLRSAAMGLVGLAALGRGGARGAGLRALALAVLVVVLLEPPMARSIGFALSVTATAGLLLWGKRFAEALARWMPRWLAEAIAVPMAAQLATEPIVVALSGQLSVVAVMANLLAGPLVGPATVVGLGVTLVAPVWLGAAQVLVWPAGVCAAGIAWIARIGASVPGAAIPWPADVRGQLLVGIGCLLVVPVLPHVLARRSLCLLLLGGMVVLLWRTPPSPGWPDPAWAFASCDVGQGDASVIRAGPDAGIVVDTGPDPHRLQRCLDLLGVQKVPLLVLTHLHADHAGGVQALANRRVAMVVTSSVRTPAMADREVQTSLPGVARVFAAGGEQWQIGEVGLTVVSAPALGTPLTGEGESSGENNASLLLRVQMSGFSAVLAGDAEDAAQSGHARLGRQVQADVLLVPHHGSGRHAASFFSAVGPAIALVSVGAKNDYGHPAARTMADVTATGARVFRTDQHGGITVSRRGDGRFAVTPQRGG